MAKIVVAGGGVVGLSAALLLCLDGHEVIVLERDPEPPPQKSETIWTNWQRTGVTQFHLPHFLLARFRALMEDELPQVREALVDRGALCCNPILDLPERLRGPARKEDDAFTCISGRRPIVEAAIAGVATHTKGLSIGRGVAVKGLVVSSSAHGQTPHVVGVRLDTGERIIGDLVIDVTGRRSSLPGWLEEIGAPHPREERDDCGFIYYGRHFRSCDVRPPIARAGFLMTFGTISALTLPADNDTWSVAIVTSAKDKALYHLRDAATWERTVRSLPLVAPWLDGAPIDERVLTVAKIEDRYRTLMVDGAPVVTGIVAIGDAWACSNPTVGRGISIGVMQAVLLRNVIASVGLDDPWKFALSFHDATAEEIEPWYRETLAADRHRLAEIDTLIAGDEYRPHDFTWEVSQALALAARRDPNCLRAHTSIAMALSSRAEVMDRPALLDSIITLGANWREHPLPSPSREQLLSIVAGS